SDLEVENEEEEEDGLAQAKSMAPVRLKDWGWRSSQKPFKRRVTQREEQEESVTRCREGSDSEDWDDLVIREQCPITVFSKKEVLKEVGRENKEMRRMKEKIKQLEHVLIRNEEREREREGSRQAIKSALSCEKERGRERERERERETERERKREHANIHTHAAWRDSQV